MTNKQPESAKNEVVPVRKVSPLPQMNAEINNDHLVAVAMSRFEQNLKARRHQLKGVIDGMQKKYNKEVADQQNAVRTWLKGLAKPLITKINGIIKAGGFQKITVKASYGAWLKGSESYEFTLTTVTGEHGHRVRLAMYGKGGVDKLMEKLPAASKCVDSLNALLPKESRMDIFASTCDRGKRWFISTGGSLNTLLLKESRMDISAGTCDHGKQWSSGTGGSSYGPQFCKSVDTPKRILAGDKNLDALEQSISEHQILLAEINRELGTLDSKERYIKGKLAEGVLEAAGEAGQEFLANLQDAMAGNFDSQLLLEKLDDVGIGG